MGRHSDPERRDVNPLHGLFRKTEPAHGFPLGEPERDPDQVETFDPITSTADDRTTEFEPPPDVNLAGYETTRRPRAWLLALGLSGALCAVVLAGGVGRAPAPPEPASVARSPSVGTVTATPKREDTPRPAATVWRTRTPEPRT